MINKLNFRFNLDPMIFFYFVITVDLKNKNISILRFQIGYFPIVLYKVNLLKKKNTV